MKNTKIIFRLLCVTTLGLAGAHAGKLQAIPKPESDPEPSEWSVLVLPDLERTPEEIAMTTATIGRIRPDTIVSAKAYDWLDNIPRKDGKPAVVLDTFPQQAVDPGPDPFAKFFDSSTITPIPHSGGTAASLLQCLIGEKPFFFIGPRYERYEEMAEKRLITNRRIRRSFVEMSGDVVFSLNAPVPNLGGYSWNLPGFSDPADRPKSSIRRAAIVVKSSLPTDLPARPGVSRRMPLVHLITGRASSLDWDSLPVDGGAAIWHGSSPGVTLRTSSDRANGLLVGPKITPAVPSWIDEYITENPRDHLQWQEVHGHEATGFPELKIEGEELTQTEGGPDNPPHDTIRSPRNLFALLGTQLDEDGIPADGDDGLNVYLEDLRSKKIGKFYYAGLSSAWPSGAKWFTDRYLIISGSSSNHYLDSQEEPFEMEGLRQREHGSVGQVRLFDLWQGTAYIAEVPDTTAMRGFSEHISFPPPHGSSPQSLWQDIWDAVRKSYDPKPTTAPMSPAEAVAISGQSPAADAKWTDLGQWPPVETWNLDPQPRMDALPFAQAEGVPTVDPLLTRFDFAGDRSVYSLAIHRFQEDAIYHNEEAPEIARADILTTGGGYLPRLKSIRRTGQNNRMLVLSGDSPSAGGDPSQRKNWLLLVDLLKHQAWRMDW